MFENFVSTPSVKGMLVGKIRWYILRYIYIYIHMIYWKSLEKTPKLQCVFLFSILFNKKHF